ncbi:hypothetical protein FRC19_002324 [Serendipita sp. 401]|nr:hypothetical protein FRC19_002324 [Serendipita sp. 401]
MGRIRFDEGDGEECAVAGAGEEEEGGGGGGGGGGERGPESPGGIATDVKEKEKAKAKLKAKGEGKDAAATPPVDEDGSAVAGPEGNGEKRGWLDLIPKWSGYGRVQLEEEKCETAKGTS